MPKKKKKKKGKLDNYLSMIKKEYDIDLDEQNYKNIILKELESPASLLDYFKDYLERNKEGTTLKWGCLIFLFIKAEQEKNVSEIDKYYKLLRNYPPNFFAEMIMAELQLRYYGNLFKAKDGFDRALELKPNDAHCHYNLGFVYYLLGMFDRAAGHYEKAIIHYNSANNPEELKARSLYNLAVHRINIEHNYQGARELLNEALRDMPDYPQAKQALRQIKHSG
jgi:tetratricopeptide (TPR) repeat protein